MSRFKNQVVVITGGASGIGEATARAIVEHGGSVVIADLQQDRGAALVEELGAAAVFRRTDVTVETDIEAAVAAAGESFGGITGMVNNAGIVGAVGSIMDTSAEAFDRTMAILSRAVFLGVKHAARAMKDKGGAIVSLSSTAGLIGGQGPHVYTMAKHAVVGLTRSAASELSQYGIRVNAVAPGGTVTPMIHALAGGDPELARTVVAEASPLGFACMPEDIANAILYLLSAESRYVTGHTLAVDAGITTAGSTPPPFFSQDAQIILHAGQRTGDR